MYVTTLYLIQTQILYTFKSDGTIWWNDNTNLPRLIEVSADISQKWTFYSFINGAIT